MAPGVHGAPELISAGNAGAAAGGAPAGLAADADDRPVRLLSGSCRNVPSSVTRTTAEELVAPRRRGGPRLGRSLASEIGRDQTFSADQLARSLQPPLLSQTIGGQESSLVHDGGAHSDEVALNARARAVLRRVRAKLEGTDFAPRLGPEPLNVSTQVERLIIEARSNVNLCQLYVGWCAFW
jgi:FKBP12-rapamycin complex-associated protein